MGTWEDHIILLFLYSNHDLGTKYINGKMNGNMGRSIIFILF